MQQKQQCISIFACSCMSTGRSMRRNHFQAKSLECFLPHHAAIRAARKHSHFVIRGFPYVPQLCLVFLTGAATATHIVAVMCQSAVTRTFHPFWLYSQHYNILCVPIQSTQNLSHHCPSSTLRPDIFSHACIPWIVADLIVKACVFPYIAIFVETLLRACIFSWFDSDVVSLKRLHFSY